MKIELGMKVQDVMSGVKGIAYSRIEYMTGCNHIGIRRPIDKNGKVPDIFYCDEPMIKIISKTKIKPPASPKKRKKIGGPREHPPERNK